MAKVNIEEIVYHLDHDLKKALEKALAEVGASESIDAKALFKAFHRQVGRQCSTWETVPDRFVDQ